MKLNYLLLMLLVNVGLVAKVQAQEYVADPSFDTGSGVNSTVWDMKLQKDGKVIVIGTFTTYKDTVVNGIMRLKTDGSIDNDYRSNIGTGFASLPSKVPVRAAFGADSSLYVMGTFDSLNGESVQSLAKINADGTPDDTFNANIGTGFIGGGTIAYTLAFQSDGKILVGGNFASFQGVADTKHFVRLNSDGTLDNTFNGNGQFNQQVRGIDVNADGKILVTGYYSQYGAINVGKIARLNSNGTLDATFNVGGTGFNNANMYLALQPDGKIIVVGASVSYNGVAAAPDKIARLNSDGTLDVAFNTGGAGVNTGTSHPQYITVQDDGKIIIHGEGISTYNGVSNTPNNIIRLNADGTKDATFDIGTDIPADPSTVRAFLQQPDGKLLIGGSGNRLIRLVNLSVLPVSLTSFNATPNRNSVVLSWKTASEKNNDLFIVERSEDANSWAELGSVKGAGTSNALNTYQLEDKLPISGTSYYRLVQKDIDGTTKVYSPVAVDFSLNDVEKLSVYPNPATESIQLSLSATSAKVIITDLLGRVVYEKQLAVNETSEVINVAHFKKGTYIVTVVYAEGKINSQKLIVK